MLKLLEKEEEIHGQQHGREEELLFHCYLLQKPKFTSMRLQLHMLYPQVLPKENACIVCIVFNFKKCICE